MMPAADQHHVTLDSCELPLLAVSLVTGLVEGMAHKCDRGRSYDTKFPTGQWEKGREFLLLRPQNVCSKKEDMIIKN